MKNAFTKIIDHNSLAKTVNILKERIQIHNDHDKQGKMLTRGKRRPYDCISEVGGGEYK